MYKVKLLPQRPRGMPTMRTPKAGMAPSGASHWTNSDINQTFGTDTADKPDSSIVGLKTKV